MKKLIAFLSLVIFVFACKNVEQFRAPIEALSADWEKATTAVTEVGSMIGAAQSSLASLKDSLMVDPKMAAKMKPEMTASLDSLKTAFTAQVDGMSGLASEVTSFATSWEEMSKKLAGLKDGLASGKLEGDVMAQIDELKTASMDATSKIEAWSTKLKEAKAAAMSAYDMYKQKAMGN
ncbi:MAG: hypothetical protein IPM34_02100 [Saprospiraceae bacterium]|nr:hypothetical protein [Saprospiraceae bacterium]